MTGWQVGSKLHPHEVVRLSDDRLMGFLLDLIHRLIGTRSQQGISFTSRGQELARP